MASHTILLGEDDPMQRHMVRLILTKVLDYALIEATNGQEVLDQLDAHNTADISAVLLDINMPGMDGFEALRHIRQTRPDLPVLMLTSQDDAHTAVKAIKAGASDFIVKPAVPALLEVALKNAIRMSQLSRELTRLKRDKGGVNGFSDLVGNTGGLADTVNYGRKAATSDVPVLITGETSTGKELLARAIHGESRRASYPFVSMHCGTIPEHNMEAVLFGYEKNTSNAGGQRSIGKFREAERGTIFLDDIHLLTPDAQVKLLHMLQDNTVEPLGATKPVKVNVRVISASHVDLKQEVQSGRLREDLYFRVNVLTIPMPALRERRSDILPLVDYFIDRFATQDALPVKPLAPDAKQYLSDYVWPGNVRELQGLIHRALVLAEGEVIDRALLLKIHDAELEGQSAMMLPGLHLSLRQENGMFKSMDMIETEAMQAALDHYGQNVTRAAEALGIAKSTFYRKIKKTPSAA